MSDKKDEDNSQEAKLADKRGRSLFVRGLENFLILCIGATVFTFVWHWIAPDSYKWLNDAWIFRMECAGLGVLLGGSLQEFLARKA